MSSIPPFLGQQLDRALTEYRAGRLLDAERLCQQLIAQNSDCFDAYQLLAIVRWKLGKIDPALECFNLALRLRPHHAEANNNRGVLLSGQQRFAEALACYDQAIAARPDYAEAHNNRGATLVELRRFDEALASYDRAIALRPNFAEALNNRGNSLQALKRFDEALACYNGALDLLPRSAQVLNNRGATLFELGRFEEAVASCDRALAAQPNDAGALNNRGVALQALRQFDQALACFAKAMALRPDRADAHWNEAWCRLLIGDFDRGWQHYEWRAQKPGSPDGRPPSWSGRDSIADKKILLYSEQGYGDTLQFCRYVPMVVDRGARVSLQVPPPLRELIGTVAAGVDMVGMDDALGPFDVQCSLLSLPKAFGTRLETIPSATPYLSVSPQRSAIWRHRLGSKRRPVIGLTWSGNPALRNDHNRSIRLETLLPLLDIDASFVSLQKDVRAGDAAVLKQQSRLIDFAGLLQDFADTAALMANVDLVVSVDTSVAHLAGALGKPVWLLLPLLPDWRWLLDRSDSPWYPSARLFRQDRAGGWDDVVARVHAALSDFLRRSLPPS